jgi:hypothetical protein
VLREEHALAKAAIDPVVPASRSIAGDGPPRRRS